MTHVTSGMYVSATMDGSLYLTDMSDRLGLVKLPFDGTAFGESVEFAAQLSPDNKYLFFVKNDDLYWVDIAVIEPFRGLATK